MYVLLLNAGSSSLKATLASLSDGTVRARAHFDWAGASTRYRYSAPDGHEHDFTLSIKGHADAVRRLLVDLTQLQPAAITDWSECLAVGHRIVHGGEFTNTVQVTPELRSRVSALADLAPLHNPPGLETLTVAEELWPHVPHFAVFDTAFHSTLPPHAFTYPVPRRWTRDWSVRRFGFHGLSHAYCARRASEMLPRDRKAIEPVKLVICHLGHGCSASAVVGGCCVDTTMGFTPMEGLMMATRSGSIDPGILLHLQHRHGLSASQIEHALNRESGLLGVSGVSADMREVEAAARAGDESAQLAMQIYAHRVRQAIGAFTATMGGIDALVFTAGVGERSSTMRAAICAGLECLGLHLDPNANSNCRADSDVSTRSSPARIPVIESREDLTMLEEVARLLGSSRGP